jgi:hypothetical protein
MASEARRGCGYRKAGALYLTGEAAGTPCCKLPILLHVCPTCNGGIKQTRGWQWLDPKPWLKDTRCTRFRGELTCALARPEIMGDRVGLLWIGAEYYKAPMDFTREAQELGVSRRIKAVPRGFKAGEHYVWLAHPRVKRIIREDGEPSDDWIGGVFHVFLPNRIEKIVTESEFANEDAMAKLRDSGITPVAVPDNDPDHQGSVHDKPRKSETIIENGRQDPLPLEEELTDGE